MTVLAIAAGVAVGLIIIIFTAIMLGLRIYRYYWDVLSDVASFKNCIREVRDSTPARIPPEVIRSSLAYMGETAATGNEENSHDE